MDYCEKCMRPLADGRQCPVCGVLSAAPVHHLKPGTLLKGRYLIGRAFEETGRTITYMARDTEENEVLAVQEYFPAGRAARDHGSANRIMGMESEERALSRLAEKARILRRFNEEPGVVRVTDVFEENDTVYTVMERPGGITLQTYLVKKGRIGAQPLLAGMAPMMQTLQRLHENGLIHRRISPETIRLYADGTVKLTGFGVAGESLEKGWLKHGYAPAEQYELCDRSDPRSDIYSLCATIYVAVTGNLLPAAVVRVSGETLVEPSRYGAQIAPQQEAALLQGLELDADRRIGSVRALMIALGIELPDPVEEIPEQEEPAEEPPAEQEAPVPEPEEVEEEISAEPEEELPDEPEEETVEAEETSEERRTFSWKELLALTKVGEEQEDPWDSFIETTLEQTQTEPVDPVAVQGHAVPETAPVPAEEIPAVEEPATTEPVEDIAPADVDFGVAETEEPPVLDKRLLGRRIAIGVMALIAVIGVVCAIWMSKTAAAEAEPYAIVEEVS